MFAASFYLGTMILTCFSILLSVFILNLSSRGARRKPLPAWMRTVRTAVVGGGGRGGGGGGLVFERDSRTTRSTLLMIIMKMIMRG